MNTSPSVTADPEDIVQVEEPHDPTRPINVAICGPTEVRELPAVRAGYRTEQQVSSTVAAKVLAFEPRRKSAVVLALTQDMWISNSQAGAMSGAAGAMRVPALIPWPVTNLDELWACAVTGSTDIGIQAEYWSE